MHTWSNRLQELPKHIDLVSEEDIKKTKNMLIRMIQNLDNLSFEDVCDAFDKMNSTLKLLVSKRQKITSPWKSFVKEIEKKFLLVVKGLEWVKENCHNKITEAFFENIEEYTDEEGTVVCNQRNLSIREAEPK